MEESSYSEYDDKEKISWTFVKGYYGIIENIMKEATTCALNGNVHSWLQKLELLHAKVAGFMKKETNNEIETMIERIKKILYNPKLNNYYSGKKNQYLKKLYKEAINDSYRELILLEKVLTIRIHKEAIPLAPMKDNDPSTIISRAMG